MKNLSSLESANLDEHWSDDDALAAWLAEDESLAQLGDTLDLQLILLDTDVLVMEPHRLPLVCEDLHQDRRSVVVQPQLDAAEACQLGPLLLQAAASDASAVVWVTSSFPPSVRALLEWLNRKMYRQCAFFGVELQLWRIGGSSPAPRFEVIIRPAEGKDAVEAAPAYRRANPYRAGHKRPGPAAASAPPRPRTNEPADFHVDDHLRAEDWLHHWQEFVDFAVAARSTDASQASVVPLPQPAARSWIEIPFDLTGIRVTLAHSARSAETNIYVLARRQPSPNLHRALERYQEEIGQALGPDVEWHLSPDEGDYIGFTEPMGKAASSLPSVVRAQREEHFARLLEILTRLRTVLEKVVDAARGDDEPSEATSG